jgi:hypothetical protein
MKEPDLTLPKSPTITIKGERVRTYAEMVIRLIRGGRPNKFYPDHEEICNLFHFLMPENCYNFYDSIEINFETGLPIEKEITRVIVDREIAPKTMGEDTEEKLRSQMERNPTEVNIRRLNRYFYHRDLLTRPLPLLMNVALKLRSVDTRKYIAFFNAEVDRFDLGSEMFAKYTLVVGQEDPRWKSAQVQLVGDDLKYTQGFRNLLSQYTVNEAEFAFILLNDLPAITIEEVQRCRIGPLYFKGVRIPEGMEEIFRKHPDTFILSLPSDRASIHIKEDVNNDPLVRMYRDTLDSAGRELRDRKAEITGYHVFKERKFVCTKNALNDFRAFLGRHNARCVVYGV